MLRIALFCFCGISGFINLTSGNEAGGNHDIISKQNGTFRKGKIYRGDVVESIDQFPFICSLQIKRLFLYHHFCGASIISTTTLVTAAHCVHDLLASNLLIVCGTNSINEGGTYFKASRIIVHNQYNPVNRETNDIALIKLTEDIPLDPTKMLPVRLPDGGTPSEGSSGYVTGWGATARYSIAPSPTLRYAHVQVISLDECSGSYKTLDNTMMCTVGAAEACQGDDGGPLVNYSGELIGVVRRRFPEVCGSYLPNVYTNVALFRPWIEANL